MKLFLSFFLTINIFITFLTPAYGVCSSRILSKVCDACADTAISNLKIDSLCPKCPELNCPSISQACIRLDSFTPFLKSGYTITKNTDAGVSDLQFNLVISKNQENPNLFSYDVRTPNLKLLIDGAFGFLVYDLINFNLPVQTEGNVLSYNCIGSIDNTSTLNGVCSTIANNEEGKPKPYSFLFTGFPR